MQALTPEEKERQFKRLVVDGSVDLFKKLSPGQRAELRSYIRKRVGFETLEDTDSNLRMALYQDDYDYPPVDPKTYFTDSDYMGHIGCEIFPTWWPHLLHICNPHNKKYEIILTGAIGLGKTMLAMLIISYKLYRISCLRDPAQYFGLSKRSKIVFGLYSITLEHAESTGFYSLRDQILDESPYYRERFCRFPSRQNILKFPKSIEIITGSNVLHSIGKNLFGLSVDEMNFMAKGDGTISKPMQLAQSVTRRLESRFLQDSGDMPGICVFISSKRATGDFIEKRIKTVNGLPGVYIVDGPIWAFRPKDAGSKTFRVMLNEGAADAMILDEVVYSKEGKLEEIRSISGISVKDKVVIDVPVIYYKSFIEDLMGSIRDIAGVSTDAINPLFTDRSIIRSLFVNRLKNPFQTDEVPGYVGLKGDIRKQFNVKAVSTVQMSTYRPKRHASAPRYIHVDLALSSDRAGVVMVHPSSHYRESTEEMEDGISLFNLVKNVEVDFSIGVTSGSEDGQEIDFRMIRDFIFWLRSVGYWIKYVSFDSWESSDSIQRLKENGIEAGVLSVDKTSKPYLTLRQAMTEGRVESPKNDILQTELFQLEYDVIKNKVDHPEDGSKDISDSLAGSVFVCLTDDVGQGRPPSNQEPQKQSKRKYDRMANKLAKAHRTRTRG